MSVRQTYKFAHTVRCKLQLAADRPDRDLRFILGHAFTLDKLRLRIAEIEISGTSDSDFEPEDSTPAVCGGSQAQAHTRPGDMGARKVSFQTGKAGEIGAGAGVKGVKERRRSPPPQVQAPVLEEDNEDGEEDVEDEGEDLGLVRFGSAAAQPPRILDDDEAAGRGGHIGVEVSEGQEVEALDPNKYDEEELKKLCEGKSSQELRDAYIGVAGCPCHGKGWNRLQVEKFWELPQPEGVDRPRLAIVQVA